MIIIIDKVIKMNSTKHPGEKGCVQISEKVYDFINR